MAQKDKEYIDDYGTCDTTHVDLRIYSDILTSHEISCRLGIEPDKKRDKGSVRKSVLGNVFVADKTTWIFSTEKKVNSRDMRRHMDYLLQALADSKDAIRQLQKEPGICIDVWCVWWSAHGHGGPTLSWDEMRELSELQLDFCLDVYFIEETMT